MIKKVFILFLIIGCIKVTCYAETTKIDLKTAINIALENNPDIKSSAYDVDIAKNEIKSANRLQNPSIGTFWNFGKAGKGNPNQIGLEQTVELGKRGARKNLAKINYELTKYEYEHKKFELKMNIAEAYVKLVVAKFVLKKYEDQQEFLENLLEISNKNNTAQNKLDLDTIEARIALNQMITEVNKAKTKAKTARIEFNKIINVPDGNYDTEDVELSKFDGSISINIPLIHENLPAYNQIENSAIKNRYDIKIAQNQVELAKKKLTVVVHQKIPDIEIASGYGYQTIGLSDDNTYKAGAYLGANLVNLPFFYTYKPEIKNAELEIKKATNNYYSTVNKAKKSVEIAYEEFITSQLNLKYYNEKILKDSDELFSLFQKTYKDTNVDFATLAAVEESYQDLVEGYAEALSDYHINWINFLRETNSETFEFETQKL